MSSPPPLAAKENLSLETSSDENLSPASSQLTRSLTPRPPDKQPATRNISAPDGSHRARSNDLPTPQRDPKSGSKRKHRDDDAAIEVDSPRTIERVLRWRTELPGDWALSKGGDGGIMGDVEPFGPEFFASMTREEAYRWLKLKQLISAEESDDRYHEKHLKRLESAFEQQVSSNESTKRYREKKLRLMRMDLAVRYAEAKCRQDPNLNFMLTLEEGEKRYEVNKKVHDD
ncbi:hypothetical protein BCR39DRAFT_99317 [Naematelia encephala]|uniref:Uncharacterized protein n=1 Tax=Naematelia encephala TaxID=71784 RepID=A0A1Y2B822_9TREE|nr:hypothetical protein BCR39DRAFT_99317 [Naematelia encephala]